MASDSAARVAGADYPKIAMFWRGVRGDDSAAGMAKHDLMLLGTWRLGLVPNREPAGLADGFTAASIEESRGRVAQLRELNPNAVILVELYFYEYQDRWLPEDHAWWLRVNGERQRFWPGTHRMDWYNPEYRAKVIDQAASLQRAGVDGVFFDNLREEPEAWVAFLEGLRRRVGDEMLILANAGYAVGRYDFAAPYLNGIMYESGWSHGRTDWMETIGAMRRTQGLLREPRISVIERFEEVRERAGWPGDERIGERGDAPPAPRDPRARRWSLAFSLVMGELYYLFADNTSHRHDWYEEYDAKIGKPVGDMQRVNPHVYTREYEGALVVVNLPGAAGEHRVEVDRDATDTLTGRRGRVFIVRPGDGVVLRYGG